MVLALANSATAELRIRGPAESACRLTEPYIPVYTVVLHFVAVPVSNVRVDVVRMR